MTRFTFVFAILASVVAVIAGGAAASGHGQWWHHTLPNESTVCNQSNTSPNAADAGPYSSKHACLDGNDGGGGGEASWAVTLGVSPNPDMPGGALTFSGQLKKNGGTAGTGGQTVTIVEYLDPACTTYESTVTSTSTGAGGSYSDTVTEVTTVPGDYYVDAESNGARSACVDVVIGGGRHTAAAPQTNGSYWCYSPYGIGSETPGLKYAPDQATAVMYRDVLNYWLPSAKAGWVDGGTNIGGVGTNGKYHLVCGQPGLAGSFGNSPQGTTYVDHNGDVLDYANADATGWNGVYALVS